MSGLDFTAYTWFGLVLVAIGLALFYMSYGLLGRARWLVRLGGLAVLLYGLMTVVLN